MFRRPRISADEKKRHLTSDESLKNDRSLGRISTDRCRSPLSHEFREKHGSDSGSESDKNMRKHLGYDYERREKEYRSRREDESSRHRRSFRSNSRSRLDKKRYDEDGRNYSDRNWRVRF